MIFPLLEKNLLARTLPLFSILHFFWNLQQVSISPVVLLFDMMWWFFSSPRKSSPGRSSGSLLHFTIFWNFAQDFSSPDRSSLLLEFLKWYDDFLSPGRSSASLLHFTHHWVVTAALTIGFLALMTYNTLISVFPACFSDFDPPRTRYQIIHCYKHTKGCVCVLLCNISVI